MSYEIVNIENIQQKIFTIRGMQVMLDSDLAELYQVEIKYLNRAVKRNIDRFPNKFKFQLSEQEYEQLILQIASFYNNSLRFQNGTLETGRGKHRKYLPYAFTEQGVSMLSAVLRSDTAVKVSITIMDKLKLIINDKLRPYNWCRSSAPFTFSKRHDKVAHILYS